MLIANAHGIYGVYSYREVFEFERFWAIGSGRSFALGAMYAGYDKLKTAREIAELGVARRLRIRQELGRAGAAVHHQIEGMSPWPRSKSRCPTSATSRTWP